MSVQLTRQARRTKSPPCGARRHPGVNVSKYDARLPDRGERFEQRSPIRLRFIVFLDARIAICNAPNGERTYRLER
jgi:hypothetical protein